MNHKLITKWLRYHALFWFLAKLPLGLSYRVASWIGKHDYANNEAVRAAFQNGLARVFADLSPARLSQFTRFHFEMMAREILDIFRLPRISSANAVRLIEVQGLEVLREAKQKGRGVILVMGHYGRPTMLSTGLGLAGEDVGMLTQIIDERNPHLDVVDRGYLKLKMRHTLAAARGRWVMAGGNIRPLYEGLNAGETIIILLDLFEPNPRKRFQAPFLGGTLGVPRGIERIATRTGAQLVYGVAKEDGWKVKVELRPLPTEPQQGLHAAIAELEKDILATPWQWWQWNVLEHLWAPSTHADS